MYTIVNHFKLFTLCNTTSYDVNIYVCVNMISYDNNIPLCVRITLIIVIKAIVSREQTLPNIYILESYVLYTHYSLAYITMAKIQIIHMTEPLAIS